MPADPRLALIEAVLLRASERLGDITPAVIDTYYRRFPDAPAAFETWSLGDRQRLEGDMVQQVLYCLMEWYALPLEIEIILANTVPHHVDTLRLRPEQFLGFIETVVETVGRTIPGEAHDETAAWRDLQGHLMALVRQSLPA